jgi:polysaccharide pyruvyl transferase WcaK-like protein
MRIVVVGGGFRNKGAEAMLKTVQAELGRRLPDSEFVLWACEPEERAAALAAGTIPVVDGARGTRMHRALWIAGRLARRPSMLTGISEPRRVLDDERVRAMYAQASGIDAAVDISGFAYGDQWGTLSKTRTPYSALGTDGAVPTVFLPQSWGSFDIPCVRRETSKLLGSMHGLVYSRDSTSSRYLDELLGVSEGEHPPRADIVFAFKGQPGRTGEQLILEMGCGLQRPLVGIAPNMRVYDRSEGTGEPNAYVTTLTALVRHLVDTLGVDVVLQANEMRLDGGPDDRGLCAVISQAAQRPGRVFTTDRWLGAEESRALVGRLDFLVGSRFHSLVFALSQGVPVMAIGWSHKYLELLQTFGLEDSVLGHSDGGADDAIATFNAAWVTREGAAARIRVVAERLRADVAAVFDETAGFIMRKHGPSDG